YFSSDMPGGYGGADIYMCKKEGNDWNSPVNLGSIINTPGNEISPYITESGELFFASDGHPGLGKKDLFLSKRVNNEWLRPVHLDPPLNSGYDDFSLITDNSFSKGYFSSDRDGSDDIYEFETVVPQLYNCDSLKENNYCFQFWDNKNPGSDTLKAVFEWQFSDGAVIKGASVEHCFPGAGKYWAFLKVTDTITGENFTVRDSLFFGIEDYKQPYITSKDTLFVSGKAAFNALRSNLPGFKTEEYIWDFGDGESALGPEVVHQYSDPGHYKVKLGIKGKENNKSGSVTYCIFKPVIVMKSNE
ncbi:MAG TPA: PKD domain-containing protein, partial [Bacteroidales bacterium]|nr:PKD domain-containing protein [Bacteroidales bacterium]